MSAKFVSFISQVLALLASTSVGCKIAGVSMRENPNAGLLFAIAIVCIHLFRSAGYALMCKKHRIECSAPFFMPFPFLFGILGTVQIIKKKIPNKKALFDIAASGPIAGLIAIIPILVMGLLLSEVKPVAASEAVSLPAFPTSSLLARAMVYLTHFDDMSILDRILVADGMNVKLHGFAAAGMIGILFTALNLLPVGQLDGGRIMHSLFGHRMANDISALTVVLITMFLFFATSVADMYFFAGILLFFAVFGGRGAEPLSEPMKLNTCRKWIGFTMIVIFLLCFPILY